MSKSETAKEQLQKGIEIYVNRAIKSSPFDKTFSAIIVGDGTIDNTYKIKLNNTIYDNVPTMGGTCFLNETVKLKVPQNNYNNMYIEKYQTSSTYSMRSAMRIDENKPTVKLKSYEIETDSKNETLQNDDDTIKNLTIDGNNIIIERRNGTKFGISISLE